MKLCRICMGRGTFMYVKSESHNLKKQPVRALEGNSDKTKVAMAESDRRKEKEEKIAKGAKVYLILLMKNLSGA